MTTYLISSEIQSDRARTIMDSLIKNLGESMQITSTLWALKTEASAKELRDTLRDQLSSGDRLMVVKSGREAAWHNILGPNQWIVDNF